jgi:hypothetical protein
LALQGSPLFEIRRLDNEDGAGGPDAAIIAVLAMRTHCGSTGAAWPFNPIGASRARALVGSPWLPTVTP